MSKYKTNVSIWILQQYPLLLLFWKDCMKWHEAISLIIKISTQNKKRSHLFRQWYSHETKDNGKVTEKFLVFPTVPWQQSPGQCVS